MNEFITNNYGISLEGYVIKSEVIAQAAKMVNDFFIRHIQTEDDIIFYSGLTEGGALSASIGSLFNSYLVRLSNGNLTLNPVKAGNPDILNISTEDSKEYFEFFTRKCKNGTIEVLCPERFGYKKKYEFDGVETKSTSFIKPSGGEFGWGVQRIWQSNKFTYSAHHNDNDNLMGIIWDYVQGIPQIVAVMYSKLTKEDWGKPHKTEGNKSTNGYSLNATGVDKMRRGWLCMLNDFMYIKELRFPPGQESVQPGPVNPRPRECDLFGGWVLRSIFEES